MIHELKILPAHFRAVRGNKKRFELRRNDRDFRVGDYLALNEWNDDHYTGQTELVKVIYMLDVSEVEECQGDFVIMSIERCERCYDSQHDINY